MLREALVIIVITKGFHSEEGGGLEGMVWRGEVCLEGGWFGGGRGFCRTAFQFNDYVMSS